jgi:NADH:ubiquinone oxidoreductase subunit B-like Fe-S oxidoreductase
MTQDVYMARKTVNRKTADALEGLWDNPSDPKSGDSMGR